MGKKALAMQVADMLREGSNEPLIWLVPIDGKAEDRDTPAKIAANIASASGKMQKNPFHTGYITESALISVGMVEWLMQNFVLVASGNRVVIIPNADQMNEEAANKLLKTFEEVPRNTYFILTADSRHSMLKTIRSRAVCFAVPSITDSEVGEILLHFGYTSSESILEFAMGSAGRAMSAIDSNYLELEKRIDDFIRFTENGDASAAILLCAGLEKSLNDTVFFLEGLALKIKKKIENNESKIERLYELQKVLSRLLAKKFTAEQALQNAALRLAG